MLMLLLILLGKIITSYSNSYTFTPLDHRHCLNNLKSLVANRLNVDHRKLSIYVEPSMTVSSFTKINSLCPFTTLQSSSKLIKQTVGSGREIGYWYLIMKISGEFSSCATYLGISELDNDFNESEIFFKEKQGKYLNCRSELPITIFGTHKYFAIWWLWNKDNLPRIRIEVAPYLQYAGDFTKNQKIKICEESIGFWCGEICISGKMQCDGVNDCLTFSPIKGLESPDEVNCQKFYNDTLRPGEIKLDKPGESFWISYALYTFFGVVGFILLMSMSKICITNMILVRGLKNKKDLTTRNSPVYSLSSGESDNDEYEDIQKLYQTNSKRNSSDIISRDEETQEELLGNSKEFLEEDMFQAQLLPPKKHNETTIGRKMLPQVELHSLSSYQLHDLPSGATNSTNISFTGTILSHGQSAISEMNSPGSSRTFRKALNKNFHKTSSYDKILMSNDISSNSSSLGDESLRKLCRENKSKFYTLSQLESHCDKNCDDDDNNETNFTKYIVV